MSYFQVLTTGADDPSLIITLVGARAIIKVSGNQHQWLGPGNRTFLEVASTGVVYLADSGFFGGGIQSPEQT